MIQIECDTPEHVTFTFTFTWSTTQTLDSIRMLANDLRRIFLSRIPSLAIDGIEIDSDSQFDDLNFSRRLELIPIPYSSPVHEWDLNVKGPLRVSSRHLGLKDDITLCYLRRGENIKLKAFAEFGTASQHAKWSPVTTIKFEFVNFNCYRYSIGLTGSMSGLEIIRSGLEVLEEKYGPLGIRVLEI